MSHPMNHARAHHVEKSRVSHLTKGYKSGGAVKHADAAEDRKLIKSMVKKSDLKAEGDKSKHRMDRPKRANGGKVGKKHGNAKTIINVIAGGDKAAPAPPPMPPPGIGPAAMPPPGPPMAAKPMMPQPGAGGPPPGMPMRARGGSVNKGSKVFEEGRKNGTQVQHTDGKDDQKDIGRGRVVTFYAGGKVKKDCGGSAQTPTRAKGGRVESPQGVAAATKLPGGSGGGEARLAKEHRAERK